MLGRVFTLQKGICNCPSIFRLLKLLEARLDLIDSGGVPLVRWVIELGDQLILCQLLSFKDSQGIHTICASEIDSLAPRPSSDTQVAIFL